MFKPDFAVVLEQSVCLSIPEEELGMLLAAALLNVFREHLYDASILLSQLRARLIDPLDLSLILLILSVNQMHGRRSLLNDPLVFPESVADLS